MSMADKLLRWLGMKPPEDHRPVVPPVEADPAIKNAERTLLWLERVWDVKSGEYTRDARPDDR